MSEKWEYGITENNVVYRNAHGVPMQRYDMTAKKWVDDYMLCAVFTDHLKSERLTEAEAMELIGK